MAMALSLPVDFPQRELFIITTFGVALFTLLVPGLTIEPLVRFLKAAGQNIPKAVLLRQEIDKLEKEKEKLKKAAKTGQISRKESKEKIVILEHKKKESEDLLLLLDKSENNDDEIERIEIEIALVKAQKECLLQIAKKDSSKAEILEQVRQRIDCQYVELKAEQLAQETPKTTDDK